MDQHPITTDPLALSRRVRELIASGRPGAARLLLDALRRMLPQSAVLTELSARLALAEGHCEQAREEIDAALAQDASQSSLLKMRAELRWQDGDRNGALQDAADAVLVARTDPGAKALLGLLLIEMDRPGDALACLQEAIATEPLDPTYRQAYARALEQCGEAAQAMRALQDGIGLSPGRVELRNAAICLAIRRRDFATAVTLGEAARRDGVVDACTFGLLGHALSSFDRHAMAGEAYAEALKLGPEDVYVRHLVAASGALPGAPRAPAEYLRAVFDGYADHFDAHLIGLGYRVPGLIRSALLRELPSLASGQPAGPLLDLGCGTGLVAVVLSDLPIAPLRGVDLSPRMLAHAGETGLYSELRHADIALALDDDPRSYGIIVAGDVLCYFGQLDALLAAACERLIPGGLLIATAESLPLSPEHDATPDGWKLGPTGRYAHSKACLVRAAERAGLRLKSLAEEPLRHEMGVPVDGFLIVLERPENA